MLYSRDIMTFKSFGTTLLILFAALATLAFRGDRDGLEFYLSTGRIYYPGEEGIAVQFGGRIDRGTRVSFDAYRIVDPVAFFAQSPNPHSPISLASGEDGKERTIDVNDARQFRSVAFWEKKIKKTSDYWSNDAIPVPIKDRGTYLIQATAEGKTATTILVITELGMVVKQSKSDLLAYVVDRRSGTRVADIPVTFVRGGKRFATVRSGADGVARTSATPSTGGKPGDLPNYNGYNQVLVLGEKGGNFVISDSYYYDYYGTRTAVQTYLHTDRPVYRPSQTVYYRGIARRVADDGVYNDPGKARVDITVTDSRGAAIARDTLTLSDVGTFNDSLSLGDEPPLGAYTITTTIDGVPAAFTFSVEEYKKPEYEVKISTDRTGYTRGDKINATIHADYYFGSPVTEATVEYQIFRSVYWRPWWFDSEWAYLYRMNEEYYTYNTQMITTGSGKLASDGTMAISYATDASDNGDYIYQIRANVVDASRRSISGSTSTKVTRGEYYMSVRTGRYIYKPGEEATAMVKLIAFDGDRPVAGLFDVKVTRYWWDSHSRNSSGQLNEVAWSGSARTSGDGEGSVNFPTKEPGYYSVETSSKDSHGNTVTASNSIYVADENYSWWHGNNDGGVQIIPDKELYKPGEMMTALVIMPGDNADALITAEGATIYRHQVQRLSSSSAIIRMPIEERFAPSIFLNVAAISGERFYTQSKRIGVAPESKIVRLEVIADRAVYRPGQSGTVSVRAVNSKGQPIANTDVALSIVDESLYAIRPDATPEIASFFYGTRYNQVTTNTSLSFYFYDYARRSMAKSARGAGAMADDMAAPSSMAQESLDGNSRERDRKDISTTEALVDPGVIRSDFRDLMLWTPSVRTDSRGMATIPVKFPDNLTTWRITARGVTSATEVGQTTAKVVARKDLLVRMETPRFITQGDKLVIATTVHNNLKSAKSVKVVFTADGVTSAQREQTLTIPSNGEERVDWSITASKIGEAHFTVKALTNEESDAMETRVPILPQGVRSGTSTMADLSGGNGSRTVSITIPEATEPASREMSINVSPSVTSSMLASLEELVGYPYGCVEQTMSRFLPTVVVAGVLEKIDVPFDKAKKEELPKMSAVGLKRLYELQHDDGGWGWWTNDETNPFMTAYVVYGMTVAQRDGFKVNTERYNNGLAALRKIIAADAGRKGRGGELTTEAYMIYVASFVHGKTSEKLYRDRLEVIASEDDINNYALSLLTMAAHLQGNTKLAERYADRLAYGAEQTATGAYWGGRTWHYNWQDDKVETSAFAVKALLATQGETELVRKGVRWLLTQKSGAAWGNTRQTAMVVYTLCDYVQKTKELDPDYSMVIRVNGREVANRRMTRADIFNQEFKVKIDRDLLRTGENSITVEKQGNGALYATVRADYYATGPVLKASDAGFRVRREYFLLRRASTKEGLVYTKQPFKGEAKSGDEILVKVSVTPSTESEYVMVEDPLPAGCEVITDASGYIIPGETGYDRRETNPYYYGRRSWNWWYADRDVRDEKVSFFAPTMSAQRYEFSYIMRAQIPGEYSVMPTVGVLMYYPEVRGNADAIAMRIVD